MPTPTFSVIIACRNPGPSIRNALLSITGQAGVVVEAIVIDGNSSDGTKEWLSLQQTGNIVVHSEPDRSVYEAMNKGARLARGSWLLFLGADDILLQPNVLELVHAKIGSSNESIFCGEAEYSDGRIWPTPKQSNIFYRNFLHHQATFYRRSLFESFAYDESLRIQADYDLNLRLWNAGKRPNPLPIRVSVCGTGGLSDGGQWANYREEIVIRHRYSTFWQCLLWDACSIARYLRKKIVRKTARARPE